jgi:hypothetical protein
MKARKQKSLGQIAYEAYYLPKTRPFMWDQIGMTSRLVWEREARAVEREVLRREKEFNSIPRLPMGQALDTILANAWRKNQRGHYPKRISWDFCKNNRAFRMTLTPRPR